MRSLGDVIAGVEYEREVALDRVFEAAAVDDLPAWEQAVEDWWQADEDLDELLNARARRGGQ